MHLYFSNLYSICLQASCSVCSAPAAIHLHYGAISCYSCRSPFYSETNSRQYECFFVESFSSNVFVLQGLLPERSAQASQVRATMMHCEKLQAAYNDGHLILFSYMHSEHSQLLQFVSRTMLDDVK